MTRTSQAIGVTIALGLLSTPTWATNGYFAHGYGARSKAMAGTGTALVQDAIAAAAINPAGLTHIEDRFDLELELFSPHANIRLAEPEPLHPALSLWNPAPRKAKAISFRSAR